jgi:hypothetical protein
MKIYEAQHRVWRLRAISLTVLVAFSGFLMVAGLKSIAWAVQGDSTAFAPFAQGVLRIIRALYEKTQFLSWGWQVAPIANPRELNSPGNYGFLFIICCGALGRVMWDSASHLSARIKKTLLRVEELGWEQSLLAQQGLVSREKPDALQINIDLQQKDQWYKRPIGLVLIGIAIAVLGQWANLQFGLVK